MSVYTPGTFFVVRTGGWAAWWIRLGTRSPFNHAGVVVAEDGTTVEAKPQGARLGNITDYAGDRLEVGTPLAWDDPDLERIAGAARLLIGRGYGWLDILSLALLQYGVRLGFIRRRVARSDRLVCSQLTDLAHQLEGVHLFTDGRPPMDVTPADLAPLLDKGTL